MFWNNLIHFQVKLFTLPQIIVGSIGIASNIVEILNVNKKFPTPKKNFFFWGVDNSQLRNFSGNYYVYQFFFGAVIKRLKQMDVNQFKKVW